MFSTTKMDETIDRTTTMPIRYPKKSTFLLTTICLLLSFPILVGAIWLLYLRQCVCENLLSLTKLQFIIAIGLSVLIVMSNLAVFLRSCFMAGLIGVMVPLIMILMIGLTLIGGYPDESRIIGSPLWIKRMVDDDVNWYQIESCIYNTGTCPDLAQRLFMVKAYEFSRGKLSPLESGCCIPPKICERQYVNVTYWEKKHVFHGFEEPPYDHDCDLWQNDETKLCYDCRTCRKGFIKMLRQKWYKVGVFLFVMMSLLIVFHSFLFAVRTWEYYVS